ncbi:MAG TPA: DUF6531 domain-containing protein, partial [Candidatus Nanopelagicales bacterium]|nr:DUF6531 domain-containing protein [Candidatus Nanopelagicales bacterium]
MSSADVGDQLTEIHRPIRPEPIFWDTAACAGAPVLVGDTPVLAAGPVTGIDTDWTAPGWRTSRSTDTNPWNTAVAGFTKWLSANDEDVQWANTVADAFAAAGGEGNVSTLSNSAINAALRSAGVDATRTDLTIEAPQAYGNPPTTGYANDPVNTSTGSFLENESDLAFPGAAALLGWGRCYNSFDTDTSGAFGLGWSSLAEAGIVFDDEGLARFRLPDGRQLIFPRLGDGWDRAVGDSAWLHRA